MLITAHFICVNSIPNVIGVDNMCAHIISVDNISPGMCVYNICTHMLRMNNNLEWVGTCRLNVIVVLESLLLCN